MNTETGYNVLPVIKNYQLWIRLDVVLSKKPPLGD
jgi:hypothetical protein